jgi:chromosome segregation ATPase
MPINSLGFKQKACWNRVADYLWQRTMYGTPDRPMNTLTDRLLAIQEKMTRLMRDHEILRRKASELDAEARESHRKAEVLKARVAELERENEVLRQGRSAGGGTTGPGTKERIDELVNEIDQCLALLKA